MSDVESQLFEARLGKLQRLRDKGLDPYPHKFSRTHTTHKAAALLERAEAEKASPEAKTEAVSLAGRVMAMRHHGKSCFAVQIGRASCRERVYVLV